MNALVHPDIIAALYEASRAGVPIDLIVRGICCLRPGLAGVSETIRVISIIGRFLEHSRAFYFLNGGQEEVYIGSADWMPRNLDRRIECVLPIQNPAHRQTIRTLLELMWSDNRQAWDLGADGIVRPAEALEPRHRAGHPPDSGGGGPGLVGHPLHLGEFLYQLLLFRRQVLRQRDVDLDQLVAAAAVLLDP